MNAALTVHEAPKHDEMISVLENSLYPGAKRDSIELVLAYCRANGLDPMLKPVHIVPTSIKLPNGTYEMRDVLMPGIADYRIKASRSGEYGGKSEPEFGPDVTANLGGIELTYPSWCRVTVRRIVQGQARDFPAVERWLENYATAKRDTTAPNMMWKKRPYGQLAKVAEAQALRMAFPEFSAGYTAEEMQGKPLDSFTGETIDAEPPPPSRREQINQAVPMGGAPAPPPPAGNKAPPHSIAPPPGAPDEAWRNCLYKVGPALLNLRTQAMVEAVAAGPTCSDIMEHGPEWVKAELARMLADNVARFHTVENAPEFATTSDTEAEHDRADEPVPEHANS